MRLCNCVFELQSKQDELVRLLQKRVDFLNCGWTVLLWGLQQQFGLLLLQFRHSLLPTLFRPRKLRLCVQRVLRRRTREQLLVFTCRHDLGQQGYALASALKLRIVNAFFRSLHPVGGSHLAHKVACFRRLHIWFVVVYHLLPQVFIRVFQAVYVRVYLRISMVFYHCLPKSQLVLLHWKILCWSLRWGIHQTRPVLLLLCLHNYKRIIVSQAVELWTLLVVYDNFRFRSPSFKHYFFMRTIVVWLYCGDWRGRLSHVNVVSIVDFLLVRLLKRVGAGRGSQGHSVLRRVQP